MAGRPALFNSPEELQEAIDSFFSTETRHTITGLALHLGFESRQSVYDYAERGEFSYIIKKAQLRVENFYEMALGDEKCTGAIFALKNMGWNDSHKNLIEFKGLEELANKLPDFFADDEK
jgi:hypothetical protein